MPSGPIAVTQDETMEVPCLEVSDSEPEDNFMGGGITDLSLQISILYPNPGSSFESLITLRVFRALSAGCHFIGNFNFFERPLLKHLFFFREEPALLS